MLKSYYILSKKDLCKFQVSRRSNENLIINISTYDESQQ